MSTHFIIYFILEAMLGWDYLGSRAYDYLYSSTVLKEAAETCPLYNRTDTSRSNITFSDPNAACYLFSKANNFNNGLQVGVESVPLNSVSRLALLMKYGLLHLA